MGLFVDVESPYAAEEETEVKRNIRYARACIRDCLLRGEFPFASHIFYTQPGILDDNVPDERTKGINAGKEIIKKLGAKTVVYTDLGISKGMEFGIQLAKEARREIEFRKLGEKWEEEFSAHHNKHSHNTVW